MRLCDNCLGTDITDRADDPTAWWKAHCTVYDNDNTPIYRGSRRCRACDRERHREAYRGRVGG